MVFQSVPFTAEVTVQWQQSLQVCLMTFYGRKLSGYDQDDIDNLAAAMDAWANDEFKPELSSQCTYLGVLVKGLENAIDLFAFNATSTGLGGVASAPLTNQNCLAVSRRTGFTGRSARGRVYFPLNLADLTTNEDVVDGAAAATIEAALNEVRQNMIFAGFEEVIVSRVSAGVPRVVGLTLPVTTYFVVQNAVSSQQRRMPQK